MPAANVPYTADAIDVMRARRVRYLADFVCNAGATIGYRPMRRTPGELFAHVERQDHATLTPKPAPIRRDRSRAPARWRSGSSRRGAAPTGSRPVPRSRSPRHRDGHHLPVLSRNRRSLQSRPRAAVGRAGPRRAGRDAGDATCASARRNGRFDARCDILVRRIRMRCDRHHALSVQVRLRSRTHPRTVVTGFRSAERWASSRRTTRCRCEIGSRDFLANIALFAPIGLLLGARTRRLARRRLGGGRARR